jgi:hypothetical protein
MRAIDLTLKKVDVDLIRVRMPAWHRYATFFNSMAFIGTNTILSLFGHKPSLISYDFKGLHYAPDVRNWFYTFADTDSA